MDQALTLGDAEDLLQMMRVESKVDNLESNFGDMKHDMRAMKDDIGDLRRDVQKIMYYMMGTLSLVAGGLLSAILTVVLKSVSP